MIRVVIPIPKKLNRCVNEFNLFNAQFLIRQEKPGMVEVKVNKTL